jgi:hypothetical protein
VTGVLAADVAEAVSSENFGTGVTGVTLLEVLVTLTFSLSAAVVVLGFELVTVLLAVVVDGEELTEGVAGEELPTAVLNALKKVKNLFTSTGDDAAL